MKKDACFKIAVLVTLIASTAPVAAVPNIKTIGKFVAVTVGVVGGICCGIMAAREQAAYEEKVDRWILKEAASVVEMGQADLKTVFDHIQNKKVCGSQTLMAQATAALAFDIHGAATIQDLRKMQEEILRVLKELQLYVQSTEIN